MGKLVIFSAPSGSGQDDDRKRAARHIPRSSNFRSRPPSRLPRGSEQDGIDYYFLTNDEFRSLVEKDGFVEWQEVYAGTCYGTLRSELDRIWQKGNIILFDVDVMGGINLKRIFGGDACSIFIMPPSIRGARTTPRRPRHRRARSNSQAAGQGRI